MDGKGRWTEDGRREERERERSLPGEKGNRRKMGRKTALAPKYVSRLIFALFSPNPPRLWCASCLGGLGNLGTTLRRTSRTEPVQVFYPWLSQPGKSGSFGMGPSRLSFRAGQ
ncbi:hypothetical protein BDW71DRAFT_107412 [Aspergillus fruticulosus]